MNKHVLMLTAATVALLTAPANAADYSSITSKVTTPVKTSTANNGAASDIDIGSGGSVQVTTTDPAVTVQGSNVLTLSASGAIISNNDTSHAVGVQLDATTSPGAGPGVGILALDSNGSINLTGTGTAKTAVLIDAASGSGNDLYTGDIKFESGSSISISGDNSIGIAVGAGTTLKGDITILGSLTGTPTTINSTSSGDLAGIYVGGKLDGNLLVDTGGTINIGGQNSVGVHTLGEITGSFVNMGSITAPGTDAPNPNKTNADGGSAVVINNTIGGGIQNGGPTAPGSQTIAATIATYGTAPALDILPLSTATTDITIGPYTGSDKPTGGPYDLVNRGSIVGQSRNVDKSGFAVNIAGTPTASANLLEGMFNSGKITAGATDDLKSTSVTYARAVTIGNYANVGTLVNDVNESGNGYISASVSGSTRGEAEAIYIGKYANTSASIPSTGMTLNNSGIISASAKTTDTSISSLDAYAIRDLSGTLRTITNSGTIIAKADTLDNGAQNAYAIDVAAANGAVTFTNTGGVTGDIRLGIHNDTITVGDGTNASYILGNIDFGNGNNKLTINSEATVSGAITAGVVGGGGNVDVTVGDLSGGTGSLTLTNSGDGLRVSNLLVHDGATLGLTVTDASNIASSSYISPIITTASGGSINLTSGSNFKLNFGSYISTPGGTGVSQFVLLDAPNGNLTIGNFSKISLEVNGDPKNPASHPGEIPFLFTGGICEYNVSTGTTCPAPGILASAVTAPVGGDAQLVLQLKAKTPAELGLGTNATKVFAPANAALGNDDLLGAAVINSVTDAASAESTYSGFLPDLSGSSRAVAVSLTDQATGPVGARQRALRMYAAQPGGTTMWGQEFVQRLNSGGNAEAYRASGFGFVLGADSGTPENGRYGGAFTFFSGDQTNKAANFTKTSNEWYMLSGYSDWRGKGLFLDTQLSAGYGSLNGRRYLELTNAATNAVTKRKATSKRAGLLLAGGLTTGAVFTYGGTVLVPQLSVDALTMRENGYTETGGGDGFDLTVSPYYAHSVRAYFGTTVRQDIDLGGFFIQPEARVGYRYDFLANPVTLTTSFASIGNKFSLTGPDPERGNIVGGASLAVTTGSWSLGLNYDYIRGTGGAVSQNATLTLVGRI